MCTSYRGLGSENISSENIFENHFSRNICVTDTKHRSPVTSPASWSSPGTPSRALPCTSSLESSWARTTSRGGGNYRELPTLLKMKSAGKLLSLLPRKLLQRGQRRRQRLLNSPPTFPPVTVPPGPKQEGAAVLDHS